MTSLTALVRTGPLVDPKGKSANAYTAWMGLEAEGPLRRAVSRTVVAFVSPILSLAVLQTVRDPTPAIAL